MVRAVELAGSAPGRPRTRSQRPVRVRRGRTGTGRLLVAVAVTAVATACSSGHSASPSPATTNAAPPSPAASVAAPPTTDSPSPAAGTPAPAATDTPSPAAGAGTAPPAAALQTPAAAQRCRAGALRVRLRSGGEGAAGSVVRTLTFTNSGKRTCTLDGHPGVSFVAGDDGHQVGAAARADGPVSRVRLAPGATATAALRIANEENYPAATCRPTPVRGFRVYPPDSRAAAFVSAPGTACANPGVRLLAVRAVQR